MPIAPEMDQRTEEIFRQLLGLTMDKPVPAQVHLMWREGIVQQHRWLSGGALSEALMQQIALMYGLGVVTRHQAPEEKSEKDRKEEKKVA